MRSTLIDRTGIGVSRLGFGTGSLHRQFKASSRQRLLDAAAWSGITHFDTSPYYGLGLAELELGRFLRNRRSKMTIATKVGLYPRGAPVGSVATVWARKALGKLFPPISRPVVDWTVKHARASLIGSLKRLHTDHVDFLLLHEPDIALVSTDEFMRWLEDESAQGTVRSWGIAGSPERVSPWVAAGQPLAEVVQTLDSLDRRQAEFMLAANRKLQFTYGYLSSMAPVERSTAEQILRDALRRNTHGAILVSSQSSKRISQLAQVVG